MRGSVEDICPGGALGECFGGRPRFLFTELVEGLGVTLLIGKAGSVTLGPVAGVTLGDD